MSANQRELILAAQRDSALLEAKKWREIAEARQAQIDRLMLEYCPDEMTPEQIAEWSKHQRPAGV